MTPPPVDSQPISVGYSTVGVYKRGGWRDASASGERSILQQYRKYNRDNINTMTLWRTAANATITLANLTT